MYNAMTLDSIYYVLNQKTTQWFLKVKIKKVTLYIFYKGNILE